MDSRIASVLRFLTDRQTEDVYHYAISRAIGPAALNELATARGDDLLHSSHQRKFIDWGLICPFSFRKTELGKKVGKIAKNHEIS
jgi:hypothetical protein